MFKRNHISGLILLVLLPLFSFSQKKPFTSISKYERRWAFWHPCAALKIKKHRAEMVSVYKEVKMYGLLDNFENGGTLDAFRHVFAMAYFSRFVKVNKLRTLGKAHEKGNYKLFLAGKADEAGELPDSLSSVMDLKNNEIAFSLSKEVKTLSIEELKQKVVALAKSGGVFFIKRNERGLYLDCGGNVIDMEQKKGTWNIPKCLAGPSLSVN